MQTHVSEESLQVRIKMKATIREQVEEKVDNLNKISDDGEKKPSK